MQHALMNSIAACLAGSGSLAGKLRLQYAIPELAYTLPRLAQLAVLGLRIGLGRELAAAVLDLFSDGLRVEAEL